MGQRLHLNVPFFKQEKDYACGPASLRMVLAHFGIHETEDQLIQSVRMDEKDGLMHEAFVGALLNRGFYCYVNESGTLEDIHTCLTAKVPVVVHWREICDEDDHYSIVVGLDETHIYLNDAWNGEQLPVSHEEFKKRWASDNLRGGRRDWLVAVSKAPFDSTFVQQHTSGKQDFFAPEDAARTFAFPGNSQ